MSTLSLNSRTRTVDLASEQTLVIDNRPGTYVQVLCGGLWLTEERSAQDRFARAGQGLRLRVRGRAVAEAIGATRVRIVEPARGATALWRALRSRLPGVEALALRSLAATFALVIGVGLPELLAVGIQGAWPNDEVAAVASAESPANARDQRPVVGASGRAA